VLYTVVRSEKISEREYSIGAELMCVLRTNDVPAALMPQGKQPTEAAEAAPAIPTEAEAVAAAQEPPKSEKEALERIRAAVLR
jgi:hypothetical protein